MTITIDTAHPGPAVPGDFAGLSFERGPLNPGHAGVAGYLFSPANSSLITLLRNLGLGNLRIGGGSVDQLAPAGTGSDGLTGIDNLFGFAAEAGVKVIYTLRLLSPAAAAAGDLKSVNARVAGYIWSHYQQQLASFAIGNEPDWHAFHTHAGQRLDPAIREEISGVPGSAYPSYLATWRSFADAVRAAAPGAPLAGPDTGAYNSLTYTPDPETGVPWTQQFASDEGGPDRIAGLTQHYYVGGDPGKTTARQAIGNMLSPEWVTGTAAGTQPARTTYIPYPSFYSSHCAPVADAGLPCRLTEANDYLTGVPGASNAFASALWALDFLHWWAAHGAAGVNFHNKQWLFTDTIVPGPAGPGEGYAITPKGYGIKAFTLGSAGQVKPVAIENPDGINLTAYCVGGTGTDQVTIINKTHGPEAADAAVTIAAPGPGPQDAQVLTLASGAPADGTPPADGTRPGEGTIGDGTQENDTPGDVTAAGARLGGAAITGSAPWDGEWSALAAGPGAGIGLTVKAGTAAIVRLGGRPA